MFSYGDRFVLGFVLGTGIHVKIFRATVGLQYHIKRVSGGGRAVSSLQSQILTCWSNLCDDPFSGSFRGSRLLVNNNGAFKYEF